MIGVFILLVEFAFDGGVFHDHEEMHYESHASCFVVTLDTEPENHY